MQLIVSLQNKKKDICISHEFCTLGQKIIYLMLHNCISVDVCPNTAKEKDVAKMLAITPLDSIKGAFLKIFIFLFLTLFF